MGEGQHEKKLEEEFWDNNMEERKYIKKEASGKMSLVKLFQITILTRTKLTSPIKLLHNRRKFENWVTTSCPLQGIWEDLP